MMRLCAVLGLAMVLGVASAQNAFACSTFHLPGGYFGKNYDWHIGQGMLIVNPRGVERIADVPAGEAPARWVARYGSVTFNQYGRDFPMGGINEAGLVVELMWLEGARYPERDARPAVGNLQWIQYQLDTAASVRDVLRSDASIRIYGGAPLHYLVADASGAVATVEYLNGKTVIHTGDSLPVAVLTNSTYADSLQAMGPEGSPPPRGRGSLERFDLAARDVGWYREREPEAAVAYAFKTLGRLSQGASTQWSIVYDQNRRRIHFRTRTRPAVRSVDLHDLTFECGQPVLTLALDQDASGDILAVLIPYTREANRALIGSSYAGTSFLRQVSEEVLDRRADLPGAAVCRE